MTRQMPAFNLKERAVEQLKALAVAGPIVPLVHFVAIGKPVRGGTHQRIKAFMIDDRTLTNITGYLCSALDLRLDTTDLSTVVHRSTLILYNLGQFKGLEMFKDAEISWQ